ncbi:UDP-N-acetylmuramoyl-tripeptide--D-alanyl-D-alanine ligase [Pollutibacter soli]|uniref:UDP-N-acetylmuramoyl-tripeptide--D-alanyl-D- alanine ligase n=1 Tax=Pollutibacter soli TaxID=3034157 RepID=UPI003013A03B
MSIETLYEVFKRSPGVQTDTRKIAKDEIFFALKGPSFNGNSFALKALELGAKAVVVDEDPGIKDDRVFLVNDSLVALQELALHHRKQFNIPFIAITGSNGKTTTKELVHAVLETSYVTYTTAGNLNNHIGVPLTILSIGKDAQMAVIEMGANHQKEIESYCRIALPTHGIITNCGKAHLEGFGGIEGVRKGKGELYDFLRANKGTAFVMWDYDYLRSMSSGIPTVITYGTHSTTTNGHVISAEPFLKVGFDDSGINEIDTRLVGDYNLPNVLVAVAVGKFFNVSPAAIIAAISGYNPSNSRSQLIKKNGNEIILDAYNANPSSMKVAIENFAAQPDKNKWIILGGMMELGETSIAEHEAIVQLLKLYSWKNVLLVGGDFAMVHHPYRFFKDAVEAGEWLKEQDVKDAMVLVKGSRSMKMERVVEFL